MAEPHYRDVWMMDRRKVIAACVANNILLAIDGFEFERFERNGEMAAIPYLRATKDGVTQESPLTQYQWVQFEEFPPDA